MQWGVTVQHEEVGSGSHGACLFKELEQAPLGDTQPLPSVGMPS